MDAIQGHLEATGSEGWYVQDREGQDPIQVPVHRLCVPPHASEMFPGGSLGIPGEKKLLELGHGTCIQKHPFSGSELQGIPFPRVVAGGDADSTRRLGFFHGKHQSGG